MSLHLPSRRVLKTAPTILKTLRPTLLTSPTNPAPLSSLFLLLQPQVRYASGSSASRRLTHSSRNVVNRSKPKDLHKSALGDLTKTESRKEMEHKIRTRMTKTRLESQSIFGDEIAAVSEEESEPTPGVESRKPKLRESVMGASLLADHIRTAVDPDPRSRQRWERKMVIRHVTRALDPKGRETREERIKRTEREALSRSPWLATSTKKLMHLARQISGKSIEEARTQMRFSKKKFAREVMFELDLARDKAVVERGMGLGKFNGEFVPGQTEKKTVRDYRHGKWVEIEDPTRMYISEAWVNRGPWRGKRPNYRARGRTDIILMPQASLTIRLKEEKTRIREFDEKKAKENSRVPWVHLPNRPVTAQRPFYSW